MSKQTNEAAAGITQKILSIWHDGLARCSPLWAGVEKGDMREKCDGATYIQFAIKAMKNSSQGFINPAFANINITPSQQFQYGILNWKAFYLAFNYTLYDAIVSGGSNDKIKYLAAKLEGVLADASRAMASASYLGTYDSIGGTQSSNPLNWDGLEDICVASGSSYAGLTDIDYTDDAAVYLPYISTSTVADYATLAKMINGVKQRVKYTQFSPSKYFALMQPDVFTTFQILVQASQIFGSFVTNDKSKLYAVGAEGFTVNDVDFYMDSYAGGDGYDGINNRIFVLPMDVLQFFYRFGFDSKCEFDTEKMRIPNYPVVSTQKFIVGNWVCKDRRLIAVNKTIKC